MPEIASQSFWFKESTLWAIVVVLVALVLRGIFVSAPLGSDDAAYFNLAWNFSPDIFEGKDQLAFRQGIVAPLAAVQWMFGYSLLSYYVFSFTFSVGLVLIVYVVMRSASGVHGAVMSSLLVSSSGLALYNGTHILPDTPNLCFLLLSFYVFTLDDGKNSRPSRKLILLAAACGFYAYLTRAPNSVFLIAIPVYEYLAHRSLRRTFYFASFFAGFLVGECMCYLIVTGNPVKRLMMVPKGVTLWIKYQGSLSFSEFLWGPFRSLLRWNTGWILLGSAVPATVHVIRERNYKLIALLSGAVLIFLVYSYSFTSLNPPVRALPLKPRYIIAFTCVLAMLSCHWLASLRTVRIRGFKVPVGGIPVVFAVLLVVQIRELPKLPSTMFFTADGYYVGDRVVRGYLEENSVAAPVYAYPESVFRMFAGYSQLDLQYHSPSSPPLKGRYYLFNKDRVRHTVRSARVRKDAKVVKYGEMLLQRNPSWDYLLETKSIVLLYVAEHELTARPVIDLAKESVWFPGKGIARAEAEDLVFSIDPLESHSYLSIFKGNFLKPGPADHRINSALESRNLYEVEIKYHLASPLGSFKFFMREYDSEQPIQLVTATMAPEGGSHVFKTSITTKTGYESFRIFLRVTNKSVGNRLRIDSMVVSKLE